jgi:hypothetical protein
MLLQLKHYQKLHQLQHLLIVFVPLMKFLIFQMFEVILDQLHLNLLIFFVILELNNK